MPKVTVRGGSAGTADPGEKLCTLGRNPLGVQKKLFLRLALKSERSGLEKGGVDEIKTKNGKERNAVLYQGKTARSKVAQRIGEKKHSAGETGKTERKRPNTKGGADSPKSGLHRPPGYYKRRVKGWMEAGSTAKPQRGKYTWQGLTLRAWGRPSEEELLQKQTHRRSSELSYLSNAGQGKGKGPCRMKQGHY